jgi:hypothetical protein
LDFWFFNNLSAISSFEFNETYYFRHILLYFSPFSCFAGPIIIIIIITGLIACSLVCLSLKLSREKKRTSSWGQSTVLFHDVICYCDLFEWISNFSDEIIVFFSFLFLSLRVLYNLMCIIYYLVTTTEIREQATETAAFERCLLRSLLFLLLLLFLFSFISIVRL